jgi:hypothetical protein
MYFLPYGNNPEHQSRLHVIVASALGTYVRCTLRQPPKKASRICERTARGEVPVDPSTCPPRCVFASACWVGDTEYVLYLSALQPHPPPQTKLNLTSQSHSPKFPFLISSPQPAETHTTTTATTTIEFLVQPPLIPPFLVL